MCISESWANEIAGRGHSFYGVGLSIMGLNIMIASSLEGLSVYLAVPLNYLHNPTR